MGNKKKISVCKKCSGFNVSKLKDKVDGKDYTIGCIGKCLDKKPKLKGKVYGYIKGKFTVCDTKKKFFKKIKKKLAPLE